MPQLTAKSTQDVMEWIETTEHHIADASDEDFFVLKGHGNQVRGGNILRIPINIWQKCFVKSGGEFDRRMYRWDHKAANKDRIEKENNKKEKRLTKEKTFREKVEKFVIDTIRNVGEYKKEEYIGLDYEVNGLKLDSLDELDVIMKLEEEYGIDVTDDNGKGFCFVKDIVDFIMKSQEW